MPRGARVAEGLGWEDMMGSRWGASRRGVVGLGAAAVVVLAGCNLGVPPVTYELVDDSNWRLSATGLAIGDIDADGDLDAVVTGHNGYMFLTNDGAGAYARDYPRAIWAESTDPSLVDVDADGDLDLVSVVGGFDAFDRLPSVRRNDGTGAFGPIELVQPDPTPGYLLGLVPSDVDDDGDVDLLAALIVGQERVLGVYLNDGTAAFAAPATYPLGFRSDTLTPVNLVAGDIDGDGDDDVVATDTGDVTMPDGHVIAGTIAMVGINDGTGGFTAAGAPIEVGFRGILDAVTPALADLDNDGDADIAVGGPSSVTTLLADGSGGFATPQRHLVPDTRTIDLITPADIDQDGNIDLVGFVEPQDATSGVVVYGDGAGGIDGSHKVGTGTKLGSDGTMGRQVATTDLEGDGDADVLFLAGSLGVVENATNGGRPNH